MARISTYVNDTNVVGADKWIGSDSQNNFQTKNFTAADVATFIGGAGNEGQTFKYLYSQAGAVGTVRPAGSLTFAAGGAQTVALNTITNFVLSVTSENQGGKTLNVSTWYNSPLVGSDILLTQCDDVTQWGIYRWVSATQKADPLFYDIVVTHTDSNGSLTQGKDYFISLLTYNASGAGGDKNEISAQFTIPNGGGFVEITHALNKYPAVQISEGTQAAPTQIINCKITYVNTTKVRLDFDQGFTGVAVLN
jgi:hypothetical protein